MVDVRVVNSESGDWQGLYIDGECVLQGHVLDAEEVCSKLSEHGVLDATTFVAACDSRFPKQFDDIRDAQEV